MESPSMMTYVVGAVLVVAVIAGAWYFRMKGTKGPVVEPGGQPIAVATPIPGPISGLGCDQLYYNPKVAFNEYYLSAEGGDFSNAERVTCTFTVSIDGKEVATATALGPLTDAPQRNGKTFRCTTKAVAVEPNVSSVVDVVLKDDVKGSATCSATFIFPPQL